MPILAAVADTTVLIWNGFRSTIASNLTPLLRHVVFVSQAALGAGMGLKRAGDVAPVYVILRLTRHFPIGTFSD